MYKVYNKLKPEMFSSEFCQDAYSVMLAMYDKGERINIMTLSQTLENHKWDSEIIASELKSCIGATPVSTEIASYADVIIKDWRAREVKNLFTTISLKPCDIDKTIGTVLTRLEEIQENQLLKSVSLKKIVEENRDKYFRDDVGEDKVKIGFYNLDDCLGGLEGGDVTVVGARPGVGKSAIVTQIIGNMARKSCRVCYYNLEMNNSQIYERFVSRASQIGLTRIRRAKTFLNGEKEQFDKANDELMTYDVEINDKTSYVEDIRAECRHQKYDVIVIDYLQLVKCQKRFANRSSEVGEISKQIKALARELHVPIILLSQLNRVSMMNATKEPSMEELRESGDIEQDASNIILLWNLDDKAMYKGLKVDKNRQGTTFREALKFNGDVMEFTERQESIEQIQNRVKQNQREGSSDDECPFDW